MARSLEDLLNREERAGKVTHLSVAYSPTYKRWQASYRRSTGAGYSISHGKTIVEALKEVLDTYDEKRTINAKRDLIG